MNGTQRVAARLLLTTILMAGFALCAMAQSLTAFTLSSTSVTAPATSTGTVTLTAPAGSSGVKLSVSSDSSSATVPASVIVPSGKSSASFTVTTTAVSTTTTANISVTDGTATIKVALTIKPPVLSAVVSSPSAIVGGQSGIGTATLNGTAPSDVSLSITSSNPNLKVASSATIKAGTTSTTFAITTLSVPTTEIGTISVTDGTTTVSYSVAVIGSNLPSGFVSGRFFGTLSYSQDPVGMDVFQKLATPPTYTTVLLELKPNGNYELHYGYQVIGSSSFSAVLDASGMFKQASGFTYSLAQWHQGVLDGSGNLQPNLPRDSSGTYGLSWTNGAALAAVTLGGKLQWTSSTTIQLTLNEYTLNLYAKSATQPNLAVTSGSSTATFTLTKFAN